MTIEKKVIAVVVTYNRLEKLKKAWSSIACQNIYGVVIVNNNSSDGTQKWIDAIDDKRLKPLHLENNIGGAGGFLRGCEYALTVFKKAEWFLLFDDDAYAQSDLLNEFFNSTTDCDLVSSKVLSPSGCPLKMNIPLIKVPTSIYDIINYSLKREKFTISFLKHNKPIRVVVSSFVGLFISYSCLKDMLCAMRPDFFIYCDDAYFTYQTYKHGYNNYYMPNLVFWHDIDISSAKINNTKLYFLLRNDICVKKEFTPKYFFILAIIRFLYYAAKGFLSNKSFNHIPIMIRAFQDGFRNDFSTPYKE